MREHEISKILRRAMTFKSVQKSLRFGLKPEQASIKWTNSLPVSTHFRDAHKRKVAWDAQAFESQYSGKFYFNSLSDKTSF